MKEKLCVGGRGAESGLKGRRKPTLHASLLLVFRVQLYLNPQVPLCPCLISPCSCPTKVKISPLFLIYPLVKAWMSPHNSYFYPTMWWHLEMAFGSELGLDEVMKEEGAPDGIHALNEEIAKGLFSLSILWGRSNKTDVCKPGRELSPEPSHAKP